MFDQCLMQDVYRVWVNVEPANNAGTVKELELTATE